MKLLTFTSPTSAGPRPGLLVEGHQVADIDLALRFAMQCDPAAIPEAVRVRDGATPTIERLLALGADNLRLLNQDIHRLTRRAASLQIETNWLFMLDSVKVGAPIPYPR